MGAWRGGFRRPERRVLRGVRRPRITSIRLTIRASYGPSAEFHPRSTFLMSVPGLLTGCLQRSAQVDWTPPSPCWEGRFRNDSARGDQRIRPQDRPQDCPRDCPHGRPNGRLGGPCDGLSDGFRDGIWILRCRIRAFRQPATCAFGSIGGNRQRVTGSVWIGTIPQTTTEFRPSRPYRRPISYRGASPRRGPSQPGPSPGQPPARGGGQSRNGREIPEL